jgi:hypothetical protein
MSIKTDAQIVRDETIAGANTAARVGSNLVAIADALTAIKPNALGFGWANYNTTTFTNASPFVIAPNSTVTLPNNANNSMISELPAGVTNLYNGTTNKITPALIGDAYLINVRFKARTSANSDFLVLFIDILSGVQINADARPFLRGANTEQAFSFSIPVFTMDTFVANGGLIKIVSNTGTISVYDITYFITRTYPNT